MGCDKVCYKYKFALCEIMGILEDKTSSKKALTRTKNRIKKMLHEDDPEFIFQKSDFKEIDR
jgi:hypothetical protein